MIKIGKEYQKLEEIKAEKNELLETRKKMKMEIEISK